MSPHLILYYQAFPPGSLLSLHEPVMVVDGMSEQAIPIAMDVGLRKGGDR